MGRQLLRPYEANPSYQAAGPIVTGWDDIAPLLPPGTNVLAMDGPAALDWHGLVRRAGAALSAAGRKVDPVDVRRWYVGWSDIIQMTATAQLADDPDFERLSELSIEDFFVALPDPNRSAGRVVLLFGPGAGLADHDALWYADQPKRLAEAAVSVGGGRNLGQPAGDGAPTTKRLFYIDWPIQDRHRDAMAESVDVWIDVQHPSVPMGILGTDLRNTIENLVRHPFRTRPYFNSTPWGGHWAQEALGMNLHADSSALGYELIAPESGVLLHDGPNRVEVPFQLLVALHPTALLGAEVHEVFGTSFPIRFDYLDTVGGGPLSIHCHPQASYMRAVFGWPYTQHESYYVMVGDPDNTVFLGLRQHADTAEFRSAAEQAHWHSAPFKVEEYVQAHPAMPHQLFLIPSGTPHGSGEGNVVLEISATPYLYSLRFYDWLRGSEDGTQRPVHVGHAFDNLDATKREQSVRSDLIQTPDVVGSGDGWKEELLGSLPEMFFEVFRLNLEPATRLRQDTGDRFHVLNVVEGVGVVISTADGAEHELAYAETLVVPAATGTYCCAALGDRAVRVVKALVR